VSEGFTTRGAPAELGFHSFITADESGTITSCHQVPDEAFAHVCDPDGKCLCGPQVVFNIFNGINMAMYRHAPFEQAYYNHHDDFDDTLWEIDVADPDEPVG
tara:strand:+ start:492 stop:797 length:306 start_codon:yes stop_codon:yes gene_type:complete